MYVEKLQMGPCRCSGGDVWEQVPFEFCKMPVRCVGQAASGAGRFEACYLRARPGDKTKPVSVACWPQSADEEQEKACVRLLRARAVVRLSRVCLRVGLWPWQRLHGLQKRIPSAQTVVFPK